MIIDEVPDYKPVRLYDGDGNMDVDWYFDFYVKNPSTQILVRIRRSFNINRIASIQERRLLAAKVITKINNALKEGRINYAFIFPDYSPTITPISDISTIPEQTSLSESTEAISPEFTDSENVAMPYLEKIFGEALDHHLILMQQNRKGDKKKEVNPRTKDTYKLYVRRFGWYCDELGYRHLTPEQFTEVEAEGFQAYLIGHLELANKTINETLGVIKTLWKIVRKQRKIKVDAFEDIKSLPVDPSGKYKPFSGDEKILIAKELQSKNPWMYLAAQFVYNCFVRPQELCCIRRSDLDFSVTGERMPTLVIRYDNGKTKRTSYREIPPGLLRLLKEMGVDSMPQDQFIFEKLCGDHPKPDYRRKKLTDLWHILIIKGLGINNNLYALKHSGNVDYILNNKNYDILWLQQQNGHSSLDMTQRYIRDLPVQRLSNSESVVTLFGEAA